MKYAKDFTIFMTAPADIQIIGDITLTYIRAMGARLNIRKSKAMVARSMDTSMNMLDIPYYQGITVLGCRLMSTVARSENVTWTRATGKIRALARDAYVRDLCLKQ
jgi:hypothetical protein